MKWNESGFRPPLCTYRLNWTRRTSWGWWDDWDDTVLQTQDSKFEPWRSEAEHATSRSRRLPTILTFTRGWGRNIFASFKPPRPGTEPRTLAWRTAVLTTTLRPPPSPDRGHHEMKWKMLQSPRCPELRGAANPSQARYHGPFAVRIRRPSMLDLGWKSLAKIYSYHFFPKWLKIWIFFIIKGDTIRELGGRKRKSLSTHLRTHCRNNQSIIIWGAEITGSV